MYPAADLLKDCQRLVKDLEKDIFARAKDDAVVAAQYDKALAEKTIGITKGAWLSEQVTQAAVAWVLATVFVRFLEDNQLIDEAWISGPASDDRAQSRLHAATLAREAYISEHPDHSDVQYLLHVVRQVGRLPACRDLFAEDRNPLFRLSVSADGAKRVLDFWREQDRSGVVIRTLATENLADTRWLGDLYQDLSADARKRFALLQTPDFVEEFILDYTLTPAIQTFGLEGLRGIDPTCGSGHFLLGMFHRLWHAWERQLGPGVPVKEAVRRAMGSIYGIDLNPFAVAISRFRLMIAGLVACGERRMKDCPDFGFTLAVGNTLTLGVVGGFQGNFLAEAGQDHPDFMTPGEYQNAKRVLTQQYHVVVGNPPYIAVDDPVARESIKQRFESCSGRWTLSVPFIERFFDLAMMTSVGSPALGNAGYVGMINSQNFAKREFGRKLIERVLPKYELSHVIDTAGVYFGTSHSGSFNDKTVMLFGRNQAPSAHKPIRAALGIRGEGDAPKNPRDGKVWNAILANITNNGAETEWVSIRDVERSKFYKFPWSLQGGGADKLKLIMDKCQKTIKDIATEVGISAVNGEDDVFVFPNLAAIRRCHIENHVSFVTGDIVRDWSKGDVSPAVWFYNNEFQLEGLDKHPGTARYLWPTKAVISQRKRFGIPMMQRGMNWYEWQEIYSSKLSTKISISFGEMATHNHFSLFNGGFVFKQTAPIIKLPENSGETDHLQLLCFLNSSSLCFWFKQVCHGKHMADGGGAHASPEGQRFIYNSINIGNAPIPLDVNSSAELVLTCRQNKLGQELASLRPSQLFVIQIPTRHLLEQTAARVTAIRAEMIFLQEELDWLIYRAYGILTEAECPPSAAGTVHLALGQRAFEIDLARKVAAEEEETSWFERHRSTPITEIPAHWPADYRQVVQRRLDLIASHPHIGLLEKPEHKRRWQSDRWDEVVQRGLRDWLCDHLEDRRLWPEATADQAAQLISTTALTDRAFRDATFAQVAALYRGNDHFDQHTLILELVSEEAVPALPALRYSDEGLIKRSDWEKVWDLQRREDAGEKIEIPVPPRYTAKDFQKATYWSHRGKLDVPKERFISYPGCQPDGDPGLLILWAGYDHAQHATALVAHCQWAKETAGWPHDRLLPLLVSLDQLVPWLKQWHNEIDPTHGVRLGDSYAEFLDGECHALGVTAKDLRTWRPTASSRATSTSSTGDAPKRRGRPRKLVQDKLG